MKGYKLLKIYAERITQDPYGKMHKKRVRFLCRYTKSALFEKIFKIGATVWLFSGTYRVKGLFLSLRIYTLRRRQPSEPKTDKR